MLLGEEIRLHFSDKKDIFRENRGSGKLRLSNGKQLDICSRMRWKLIALVISIGLSGNFLTVIIFTCLCFDLKYAFKFKQWQDADWSSRERELGDGNRSVSALDFGAILGCIQSLSKMEQMTKVYRMSVSRSPGAPVAGHWKYLMIVCGWMPSVAINLGRGRAPAQLRHKCPRYWKRSKLRHQSTAAAAIKMIGQYNFKRRFAKISQSRRKPLLGPPS